MATRKIAVLTSGGDAPGMNAAIRAVVRTGIAKGWEMFGVRDGYAGLVAGLIEPLGARDVGGILQRGGTFLGSARCREFKDEPVRARGLANLRGPRHRRPRRHRRQRLAVGRARAGADGPRGRRRRVDDRQRPRGHRDHDRRRHGAEHRAGGDRPAEGDGVVAQAGVPRRGDGPRLRLPGADGGHRRRRRVGRRSRRRRSSPRSSRASIQSAYDRGKAHALVVVAEGARIQRRPRCWSTSRRTAGQLGFDLRVTTLGHVQRGGAPGAFDRLLATRLAAAADRPVWIAASTGV